MTTKRRQLRHTCHSPGCDRRGPANLPLCKRHWSESSPEERSLVFEAREQHMTCGLLRPPVTA
jgi:hypothetical protein